MEKVAVIMSSYNGMEFIQTQIDSILAQKNVDVTLFVRDDGSTDGTVEFLKNVSSKYNNVLFLNPDKKENRGVMRSFMTLLEKVVYEHPEFAYFAFADQDDFWMEDKLGAAVTKIKANPDAERNPVLYYSNKIFADRELNIISEEHIPHYGDFLEVAYICRAQGCTQVMNRRMAEIAVSPLPEKQRYHDSYIYRLALSINAEIIFDEVPHMMYRQHNNVFGMRVLEGAEQKWSTARHILNPKKVKAEKQNASHWVGDIMEEIRDLHEKDLSETGRTYIYYLTTYYKKLSSFLHLAFCKMARKRGLKSWCHWIWNLMIGNI